MTNSVKFKKRKHEKILWKRSLCMFLVLAGSLLSPFVNSSEIVLCVGEDFHFSYEYSTNETCCSDEGDYSNTSCIQLEQDDPFETNCLDIQLVALDFGQPYLNKKLQNPLNHISDSYELNSQFQAVIHNKDDPWAFLKEPQSNKQLFSNISTIRLLI